jgi:aspartyl-tRNA(Asn)/glutamyl-tRNA(Gln) amidotransferase subunit B
MSQEYKATIGLEIHAELKTHSKMFCSCKNDPMELKPNVNICPVCMGHPGTLPVINKEAVKNVLKVGYAVSGQIADFTEWDRKNYFYPDIPKGYQISQYKYPLVKGGKIDDVVITRIHLEEDTASSSHDNDSFSLVDFNRAGVPLMELVTEPVIHTGEQAVAFAKELQLLLRFLDVSDANMEKGEMRVEANISVSQTDKFGTKTEVKNLNSFRAVERAINFEIKRQISLLESGQKVVQETRGWDEGGQKTFSQRVKEDSHDYRYFPDPDLPKLKISEIPDFKEELIRSEMGELPWEMRKRLTGEYDLKIEDVDLLLDLEPLRKYFEEVAQIAKDDKKLIKLSSNYIISDYLGMIKKIDNFKDNIGDLLYKISPNNFVGLMNMTLEGKLSSRGTKDILKIMFESGGEAQNIASERGLLQTSDEGEIEKVLKVILESNPGVVADYKNGKESSLQFFVGQGMKATKGSANPQVLKDVLLKLLS